MNTYISLLSTDDYLPGVLVVNKCLKLTNAQFPFTILVTENISNDTISILKKNDIQIIVIDRIVNTELSDTHKWRYNFTKLHVYNQTQFSKIVYIDLDMVITENLDHLFYKNHMSAVNSGGFIHSHWKELNSGLIVIEPSNNLYNDLIFITKKYPLELSGDQSVLHKHFDKWHTKKKLNLGYQYNMFINDIPRAIKELNFTVINNIDEINEELKNNSNIKIFHYINPKPWDNKVNNNKYYSIWYNIYESIKIK